MNDKILIRKYKARRLYHTGKKCYITLKEVTELIQEGYDVKVVDNQTKEDITQETLLQIVLEQQKNSQNLLPSSLLHQMIRKEESVQEFWQLYLENGREKMKQCKQYIRQQFQNWQKSWNSLFSGKSETPEKISSETLATPNSTERIFATMQTRLAEYEKKIQEIEAQFKDNISQQFQEWNQKWEALLEGMPNLSQLKINALEQESQNKSVEEEILAYLHMLLAEYEKKIQELEAYINMTSPLAAH